MNRFRLIRGVPLVLALAGGLCACSGGGDPEGPPLSRASLAPLPAVLPGVASLPVAGPRAASQPGLRVTGRTPHIGRYPCSACHDQPLAEAEPAPVERRRAHVNMVLRHAGASVMDCRSCHNPADLNTLVLNDGTPVGLDQVYRLCAECHFEQERDWAGGAHGKRVGGWNSERVILNCTDCHDPHAPAFESRWPVLYPRIPRTARTREGT